MRQYITLLVSIILFSCQTTGKKSTPSSTDWEVAVIAWTFNELGFLETADKVKQLGLNYIGTYPGQPIGGGIDGEMQANMNETTRQEVLRRLKDKGVKLVDFGVVTPETEDGWRQLFAFAKSMGIGTIVSEPHPGQLALVSRLCEEHKVRVAIHNHPAPSFYASPDTLKAYLNGQSPLIGACADVGHWVRSGYDPVKSLRQLEGRIFELHFKDISHQSYDGIDTVWGKGVSNVPAMLEELKRQRFDGFLGIEYENNNGDKTAEIKRSLEFYEKTLAQ